MPQRSWSVRTQIVLLPLGRLHGFRDRADAVDVGKLHDAYRIVTRTVRVIDERR